MAHKVRAWITAQLFSASFASVLENRQITRILIGIVLLQLGVVAVGLDAWPCPIKAALGVPCPGCGLSTAVILLIQGKWIEALSAHAFAPLFLFAFILMAIVAVLSEQLYQKAVRRIAAIEHRTGIVIVVLLGLIVYWMVRLF